MKTFRFDDISINTDMVTANKMMEYIYKNIPSSRVIYAMSPMVFNMSKEDSSERKQSLFPKMMNALSDYKLRYKVQLCGLPDIPSKVIRAGHGLVHIDHRLMDKPAQELSIVASCGLADGNIFVPPENKWNHHTEDICREHQIELIKFENGWLSMEHNLYDESHDLYYCHPRAFKSWFENKKLDVMRIH